MKRHRVIAALAIFAVCALPASAAPHLVDLVVRLQSATGLAADRDGNVYIVDTWGNAVAVRHPGEKRVQPFLSSSDLDAPLAVALDEQGNLFIADGGAIKKRSVTTGNVTTLVSGLSHPEGVGVDPSGDVYFSDTSNNAVKKWIAATQEVVTVVTASQPGSLAVDLFGDVYFIDTIQVSEYPDYEDRLLKWSAKRGDITELGVFPIRDRHHLFRPRIAVDAGGNVYFTDDQSETVGVWSTSTPRTATTIEDTLPEASGVAIDPAGNLYALATGTLRTIDIVTHQVREVIPLGFLPRAMAILPSGAIYVLESETLKTWNGATGVITSVADLSADQPFGLAADDAGNLYYGAYNRAALVRYNVSTGESTTLARNVQPTRVACDHAGNVYFLEGFFGPQSTLKVWSPRTGATTTLIDQGLDFPGGLAVDDAGNVYIGDTLDGRIEQWNPTTTAVVTLVDHLDKPESVAVDHSGNLYIAERQAGRIRIWSSATHRMTAVSPAPDVEGIVIDRAGRIYVLGDTLSMLVFDREHAVRR